MTRIHGGVIHAYLPSVSHKKRRGAGNLILLKCIAYEEDIIAFGAGEQIAVKKLWIPLEEIERATKLAKRRGYKI